MVLSKLSSRCQKCKSKDTCSDKRMEACAYYPEPVISETASLSAVSMIQPIIRETTKINIYGEIVEVYKDDLEKQIHKALCSQFELWKE